MSSANWGRLALAVLFLVACEFSLLFWVHSGWVALGSGFLGSLALIIPSLRLEFLKSNRTAAARISTSSTDLRRFTDDEVVGYFAKRIDDWHAWDSFFIIIGGVLLAFYFGFQAISKSSLADKDYVSSYVAEELARLRAEEIRPLRDSVNDGQQPKF